MITDLWIENFKGIGKRQHIPLRPVTLLFGANSAGKSTVMHALAYLRGAVCNQVFDPQSRIAGEGSLSLGGFRTLVHRNQTGSDQLPQLVFEANIRMEPDEVSELTPLLDEYLHAASDHMNSDVLRRDLNPESISLKLIITDSSTGPTCSTCELTRNGEPFVRIELHDQTVSCHLNCDHPWLKEAGLFEIPELQPNLISMVRRHRAVQALSGLECVQPVTGGEQVSAILFPDFAVPDQKVCTTELWKLASFESIIRQHSGHARDDSGEDVTEPLFLVPRQILMKALQGATNAQLQNEWELAQPNAADDGVVLQFSRSDELQDFTICAVLQQDAHEIQLRRAVIELYESEVKIPLFGWHQFELQGEECALPETGAGPLGLDKWKPFEALAKTIKEWYGELRPDGMDPWSTLMPPWSTLMDYPGQYDDELRALLSQQIRASVAAIANRLEKLTYIGPKRSTVPREMSSENSLPDSNWGNGLGAWTWLLNASDAAVENVSEWLGESRLNSGYSLIRERDHVLTNQLWTELVNSAGNGVSPELLSELSDSKEVRRLLLRDDRSKGLLHPQEVGEGICQVIPIVVALIRHVAQVERRQVTMPGLGIANIFIGSPPEFNICIEQPELHLHPALAARLGDLFIYAAQSSKRLNILAETHSEHIILRLLRRIRQTADNELPDHIPPVKPDDVCVLYVDNLGDGTIIKRLRIDEHGEFIDRWPHGFFSERAEELF